MATDPLHRVPRLALARGCSADVIARGWRLVAPERRGGEWQPGSILAGLDEWGSSLEVPAAAQTYGPVEVLEMTLQAAEVEAGLRPVPESKDGILPDGFYILVEPAVGRGHNIGRAWAAVVYVEAGVAFWADGNGPLDLTAERGSRRGHHDWLRLGGLDWYATRPTEVPK